MTTGWTGSCGKRTRGLSGSAVLLGLVTLLFAMIAPATNGLAVETELIGMYRCGYHFRLRSWPFTWYVGFKR